MSLLLLHCTPHGEPVGIWNDTGAHYYANPKWLKRGQMVFDDRGTKTAWSSWVEDLVHTPPHEALWKADDTPIDMHDALETARTEFFNLNKTPMDSDSEK